MTKNRTGRLARLLLPAAALFALAGALLVPAEAGLASSSAAAPRARRARQEEARAPEKERPAESTVRGRVVYDDTERPVRRAQITLLGETGDRTEFGALTDARGYFTIRKVRAGTYVVAVGVPGVISPTGFMTFDELRAPGLPDFGEGRKFFDVVEVNGKEDATVTVHARRGAALSGRVTYADGDPAPSVTVHIVRRDSEGRLRRLLPSGLSAFMLNRTDDRGQFRVAGLPPGEYYVSVTEAAVHGAESRGARPYGAPNVIEELAGQHFLVTYHPSASGVKEAESVKVAAGEERADVDVVIPERALRTVAGQVRSRRDGRPVARARVTIVRRDDASEETAALYYDTSRLSNNGTTTDEAGRFQFKEIPDGAY
ncbi:MAG TPA: carboxypeptidase-like regulatory domain-containing protein, partial [Pyrinomonadaceae bacterium]